MHNVLFLDVILCFVRVCRVNENSRLHGGEGKEAMSQWMEGIRVCSDVNVCTWRVEGTVCLGEIMAPFNKLNPRARFAKLL